MAGGIPGARFAAPTGGNHLFLETEPAFGQFLDAEAFAGIVSWQDQSQSVNLGGQVIVKASFAGN